MFFGPLAKSPREENMPKLLNIEELSQRLGVSRSFIYDRTRKNGPEKIPHFKLGKYVRFDPDQIEIWLTDREKGNE
jgi:excisionase family DNA binding protein